MHHCLHAILSPGYIRSSGLITPRPTTLSTRHFVTRHERFDFCRAHVTWMTRASPANKKTTPVQICLLGTLAEVQVPYAFADLIEGARRLQRRKQTARLCRRKRIWSPFRSDAKLIFVIAVHKYSMHTQPADCKCPF